MNEKYKISLSDLLPGGYYRYKERNGMWTADQSWGYTENLQRVKKRANFLRDYDLILEAGLFGSGLILGAAATAGLIGLLDSLTS